MDLSLMTLEKFEEAADLVMQATVKTKLIHSEQLSKNTGNKIFLKPENMQNTGSFKVRGIYYKLYKMTAEEKKRGFVTASHGNFAIAAAFAAKEMGIPATIVMPDTASLMKVNRTKMYGARVEVCGHTAADSLHAAEAMAKEEGLLFIDPAEDIDIAIGNGSLAMEIIKECPTVDYIVVPAGTGSLLAGVAALARLLNPKIRVIGAQPAGANALQSSFETGEPTVLDRVNSIADAAVVAAPSKTLFPYIREYVDDIIAVEDSELIAAFLDMVEDHKMVAENSGLLAVAALKHLDFDGKKVAAIISGGNMDVITMSSVVSHGLILRDRVFTVSVLLPDNPGQLARVSELLAQNRGNVIKLEHNQFISINRSAAVELKITLEADGTEHKNQIVEALNTAGYRPKLVRTQGI